jgi:hypothetical protein
MGAADCSSCDTRNCSGEGAGPAAARSSARVEPASRRSCDVDGVKSSTRAVPAAVPATPMAKFIRGGLCVPAAVPATLMLKAIRARGQGQT